MCVKPFLRSFFLLSWQTILFPELNSETGQTQSLYSDFIVSSCWLAFHLALQLFREVPATYNVAGQHYQGLQFTPVSPVYNFHQELLQMKRMRTRRSIRRHFHSKRNLNDHLFLPSGSIFFTALASSPLTLTLDLKLLNPRSFSNEQPSDSFLSYLFKSALRFATFLNSHCLSIFGEDGLWITQVLPPVLFAIELQQCVRYVSKPLWESGWIIAPFRSFQIIETISSESQKSPSLSLNPEVSE